ncbi:hypothetical protein RIF29_27991 [Crotalaria pallida]|uniref:Uncharacterized protein n=1 Tax=Crotalaria pallida TaxID=3830 RepID=A0AAN9EUZ0_CROPI
MVGPLLNLHMGLLLAGLLDVGEEKIFKLVWSWRGPQHDHQTWRSYVELFMALCLLAAKVFGSLLCLLTELLTYPVSPSIPTVMNMNTSLFGGLLN